MHNWRITLTLLVIALVMIVPVYAQEEAPVEEPTPAVEQAVEDEQALVEAQPLAGVSEEPETETATGLTVLVLLLGLGAVAVVGGLSWLRSNYKAPQTE